MADSNNSENKADSGWDDYAERVLRNEGRLIGLEQLVSETREADRKLIEQRSESLARELERRAEALVTLAISEREADLRESRDTQAAWERFANERWASDQRALRLAMEALDVKQSDRWVEASRLYDEKVHALEGRRQAATDALRQLVEQWRISDREARELQADEYARRLDELNNENQRIQKVQASSVTRELYDSETKSLTDRVIILEAASSSNTSRSVGQRELWAGLAIVATLVVTVVIAANAIFGT